MNEQTHPQLKLILFISNLSIFMIGLGFAVRANIAPNLQADLFNVIDLANSTAMVGEALGMTFTGFALTLLFGSALVDWLGARIILLFSALGYVIGSVLVVFASLRAPDGFSHFLVMAGLLLTGLGWGAVEAASNPLVAAIDPKNKVHRLNVLHAWWPAGIVIGGLSGVAMSYANIAWQVNLALLIVPGLVLGAFVLATEFPPTERVASGVSYREMFQELFKQPMFYVFWVCMWLTATSELAPGQWVEITLSKIVGMKGILLLVYVSGIMFVMRHFAGSICKHVSSVGLMWLSALFAAIGLFALSRANSPVTAFLAATVWAVGVCYMWPTMVAITAERFPRGGALFMGLMGFGGGMAIQFALPVMGRVFDQAKITAAGGVEQLAALSGEPLDLVLQKAAVESFQSVAIVPVLLLPIFGTIWLVDVKKKQRLKTHKNVKAGLSGDEVGIH